MPVKIAWLSTISMIIGTRLKKSWQPTIGNNLPYLSQTIKALKTASLNDIKEKASVYDVVAIDEGQFYQ